jgi:hypothetical protein
MEIWQRRVIVADDDLDLDHLEITLTEARKIEPDFEIGEEVSEEVKLVDLGRRAILALRQNLISKIHEHDNTNLYKQFKDIIGDINLRNIVKNPNNHIEIFNKIIDLYRKPLLEKEKNIFYMRANNFECNVVHNQWLKILR